MIPVGIFIAALGLGLFQIGAKSLWHDEAISAGFLLIGPRHLLGMLPTYAPQDDLYLVVVSFWTKLAGGSEAALRAPSALFAATAAAFVYLVATRLTSRRVALSAAALLVVSEMFLAYAQEARPYAFALLLCAASTYVALRVADRTASRPWLAAYVVLATMAIYAHMFTAFVVAAQLAWLASASWRPAIVGGFVIGMASLPLVLPGLRGGTPGWIAPLSPDTIRIAFLTLAGGSWALLIAAVLAIVRSLWLVARGHRPLVLPLLLAVFPIAGLLILSLRFPALVARYMLFALPGLAIVCAAAAWSLRPRWVAVAAFTALLVVDAAAGVSWYTGHPKDDTRGMAATIVAGSRDGDAIIYYPVQTADEIGYYLNRTGRHLNIVTQQDVVTMHPRSVWVAMNYFWTGSTPPEVTSLLSTIEAAGYKSLGVGLQPHGLRLLHYMIPAKLSVSGLPSPVAAGVAGLLTVKAVDAKGRTWADYQGTVHFTSTDAHAILPADYTFTAADAGVHTFSVTFASHGEQRIRARDTVTEAITGVQANIIVSP